MNGLALRITGKGRKTKNTFGFATVTIPENYIVCFGKTKEIIDFIESSTVDKQLEVLRNVLNSVNICFNEETVKFLVFVFLQAEVKHPIKCFLARYITKCESIQQPFSTALSEAIATLMTDKHTNYKQYSDVVTKVASCLENFPTGAVAVKKVEIELAEYLKNGLVHIVNTFREVTTLSPTEKNEIFNLAHSILRLILYIVQKVSSNNISYLTPKFVVIRSCMKDLLFDNDVPMDTKSVCGIVYVTMQILEHNPDSWMNILKGEEKDGMLESLLDNDASRLSLYSAVVTVIPTNELQNTMIDDVPAILVLTDKVIAIDERMSSDSTFSLGAARTLLQLSKALHGTLDVRLDTPDVRSGALNVRPDVRQGTLDVRPETLDLRPDVPQGTPDVRPNKLDMRPDVRLGTRLAQALLRYVWPHLEHAADSVRHLSAQALANIVRYCAALYKEGDSSALDNLFVALKSLDSNRKSFYVSLTALTFELGADTVLARLPDIVAQVMGKLHIQAVQASATTALETLLMKQMSNCTSEDTYRNWVAPIMAHAASRQLDTSELTILEGLLAKAVKLDENIMNFIVPHIKEACEDGAGHDLKCVLMLLGVARKSGVISHIAPQPGQWRNIIGYDVLQRAAVNSLEQTRILSLSLIVESPKTTEIFTPQELDFVLYFLKYNGNAQAPNFRQLMLSLVKKFIKRLEDSYKVLIREKGPQGDNNKGDYYVSFLERLRAQCFASLLPGAHCGRRGTALQTLVWCGQIHMDGYDRHWNEDYVEKLLLHLEDSYENNKALALEVLNQCPVELLKSKKYSTSLELEDILRQASSVKPTDCVSAAYKLNLLKNKLPENILQGEHCVVPEPVDFTLLRVLLQRLRGQLALCGSSILSAARDAPMYGALHCMKHVMDKLRAERISEDATWSELIEDIITTCIEVNAAVACVVNNSSPEGHLPMDMGGVDLSDHGNSGNVRLSDGRAVTAQMVLLCAWRSVKEVSLLLGCMCSRLVLAEECEGSKGKGSLSGAQLRRVGRHFTALLASTKHRGAFEQAYVGFCSLLARLWRCRSPELHELPRSWLRELMLAIQRPPEELCATRRSAGLPFMIQALVTTELQVRGNPACFHECAATLLQLAGSADVTSRVHCANVLRALVRSSALQDAVAPHVAPALLLALTGFEGNSWEERNSSTLLFSALTVRIFGVQRSRDYEQLCARNRMTGRIFFLRYPQLYDYMLNKLQEVSSSQDSQLRPSLYPILLLLSRLYPSSLEGTVSNLKLVAFIPHVVSCAGSSALAARRLAARALPPLLATTRYASHIEEMLKLLCNENIKRNFCHGILLQVVRLLDNKPDDLHIDEEAESSLKENIEGTVWILRQANGRAPCYLIADEYLKMINLLLWRFPTLLHEHIIEIIINGLDSLLFKNEPPVINSGKDLCLANAAFLYFIILNIYKKENVCQLVHRCLRHESYEVVLAALNYILIMYKDIDIEDTFQEHLSLVSNINVQTLQDQTFFNILCDIMKHKYLECNQKALKVLVLSGNTHTYIIRSKEENIEITDDIVLQKLLYYIETEHDNLTHIYLQSLSNFLTKILRNPVVNGYNILEAIRMIFACSSSDNSDDTRSVVVDFLYTNIEVLLALELLDLKEEEQFEYKATLYCILVMMLEDDDVTLAQTTCDLLCRAIGVTSDVIPSKCAEILRDHICKDKDAVLLFVVLALLDFKSEVVMTDEENDECRVFDQNERYNVYLEETIWTRDATEKIKNICNEKGQNLVTYLLNLMEHKTYKETIQKLCSTNLVLCKNMCSGDAVISSVVNPKIELFIRNLCI
ncbi:tRNA (32-2'-O)-methyltransferase regulator THADA [Epargyreus clarus]|uniref:tRNA (32-2'-O)-methyltransferase regulator THADA n=1 Tax=Epargyreus clarus TaxID=520877 RepID=UPI003C2C78FE